MVALKPNQVDRALKNPDKSQRVILVYGPDTGLVIERANLIAANTGVDPSDPFSTIRLDADDIASEKSRLLDEANTIGMFGSDRLIRVSGMTRKNLVDAIKPVLDNPPGDSWVIVEAGELTGKSALRTAFEKSPHAIAIPCYPDNTGAIENLIREEITARGQTISPQVVAYLKTMLGGDRMASRNELEKLSLYTLGEAEITLAHVREIVGDASAFGMDDVIDAVSNADMASLEENLERTLAEGLSPDMLILAALRHFQQLHELRSRMESSRISAAAAVDGARPPIFWKRKPLISSAISKLELQVLEKIIKRLQAASFTARSNPEIGRAVAGTSLLAVILEIRAVRS
jgi:DNA polymerase-3 subunit delta